jgi:hypothetical protein
VILHVARGKGRKDGKGTQEKAKEKKNGKS